MRSLSFDFGGLTYPGCLSPLSQVARNFGREITCQTSTPEGFGREAPGGARASGSISMPTVDDSRAPPALGSNSACICSPPDSPAWPLVRPALLTASCVAERASCARWQVSRAQNASSTCLSCSRGVAQPAASSSSSSDLPSQQRSSSRRWQEQREASVWRIARPSYWIWQSAARSKSVVRFEMRATLCGRWYVASCRSRAGR